MRSLRDTEALVNSLGEPLSDAEQASLLKCLNAASLGVDTCLVEGLPYLYTHMLHYLEEVSVSQSDDLELVEGAMLLVEQLALALAEAGPRAREHAPLSTPLRGRWQVLLTTGGGFLSRLQWVPIIELLDVAEDGASFRLESKMGPLYSVAVGAVAPVPQPLEREAMEVLAVDVTDFRVELGGLAVNLPSPQPHDTLAVAAVTPAVAVVRCRSPPCLQLLGRPM
ncbi:hypothetical protein HYH03_016640 [Edaphochlamys debaryana]|uniref:Uncharacterized protein n=1 Tax=Edaphochlamys debaryana TaxID=47281 RepID=A0A836BRA3_9CHLO|nr:hypothetical protein HYH03_016640 [Edaphochlamys debaryana]|eukprot:KAG2484599.1 hypothetical protein HYH03_016640 [Edaphochlamys debaryana]